MSQIFLSYARDDVDPARQLADGLAQAGHDVWWDRHLHGGSRFDREIEEALGNAEAVVVLWSKASLDSAWVKDEAAEARDFERLVPVSIGSAKPPLGFRQFHTIDLGSWNGHGLPDALEDLLSAIDRTCGSVERTEKATAKAAAESAQQKLSICVLPFANMSGEPEQEYFSDGITEDIITDLSKVSALSVVARNTAFTFKGQSRGREGGRGKARRQPRAGRQRAQGREPRPDHRAADRRRQRAITSGQTATIGISPISSRSRTRSRRQSSRR